MSAYITSTCLFGFSSLQVNCFFIQSAFSWFAAKVYSVAFQPSRFTVY